jgi:hypothetical protein
MLELSSNVIVNSIEIYKAYELNQSTIFRHQVKHHTSNLEVIKLELEQQRVYESQKIYKHK